MGHEIGVYERPSEMCLLALSSWDQLQHSLLQRLRDVFIEYECMSESQAQTCKWDTFMLTERECPLVQEDRDDNVVLCVSNRCGIHMYSAYLLSVHLPHSCEHYSTAVASSHVLRSQD